MPDKTLAQFVCRNFERLQADRRNWDSLYQTVADLMLPSRDFTTSRVGGENRQLRLYDSTAQQELVKAASFLHGSLTNPATKWFNLRHPDEDFNTYHPVREWLDDCVNRMLALYNSTRYNFNTQSQEVFLDLVAFGTAAMIFTEKPDAIRFAARPLREMYLAPDSDNGVEAVYRCFTISNRHAFRLWGDGVAKEVKRDLEKKPDDQIEVIHAVYPRSDRNPQKIDSINKPLASVYVDKTHGHVMSESGFDEMPYLTPRFFKSAGEAYGRGFGVMMLPQVGMVNELRRVNLMAMELNIAPPLIAEANSTEGPIRTTPFAINYVRAGSRDPLRPLMTGANAELGDAILEKERAQIKSGFYTDMMVLPEIDRMTTLEVAQRVQQKMVFLSPMLSRVTSEYLGPKVRRTFKFMLKSGMFKPMPPELSGQPVDVEFVSVLAMSQRLGEASAAQQWLASIAPLAQADPSILDWIDTDVFAQMSGVSWHGVQQRLQRTPEVVAAIRQARAQAMAQQQQIENFMGAARAAKDGAGAISELRGAA